MTFTHALSTNNYGPAKFIVDSNAANGSHTTIASALTSSASGDTIFIRPGTYTENITLKAGVNLTAFGSDASLNGTGKVIISGTCTMTTAGSVTISGIQLQTNSAALLAVTGSAASIVNLENCYLNCTNTTGITFSSSSASSIISMKNTFGDIGTTGITLFAHSSAGNLGIQNCNFFNTGGSTTASTVSAGFITIEHSNFQTPITTSGTASIVLFFCTNISTNAGNATSLTVGGSGSNLINTSSFASGSASAISISQTLTIGHSIIYSDNTNAITGAGTIAYAGLIFQGASYKINTTTQSGGTINGGLTQAPSVGFLGQIISSTIPFGSAVALTTGTGKDVTSISLTPGVWNVTGCVGYLGNAATSNTSIQIGVGTVTNTIPGNYGLDTNIDTHTAVVGFQGTEYVPCLRVTLTATTTYYLVAFAVFTVNTYSAYGTITATRVG